MAHQKALEVHRICVRTTSAPFHSTYGDDIVDFRQANMLGTPRTGESAIAMRTLSVALAVLLQGCGNDACPNSGKISTVTTGITDLESLTYVSAPWDGPLDDFGARSTVTFVHHLGVVPDLISTFLSFDDAGTGTSDVTENAGNQGQIECVDANSIRIHNNTCAKFYIRVVAARLGETGEQSMQSCD